VPIFRHGLAVFLSSIRVPRSYIFKPKKSLFGWIFGVLELKKVYIFYGNFC
jgi:hypothetical protein